MCTQFDKVTQIVIEAIAVDVIYMKVSFCHDSNLRMICKAFKTKTGILV